MNASMPVVIGERMREKRPGTYPRDVAAHPWSIKSFEGRPDFLLSRTAEQKVRNHCLENPTVEAMGLLVGDVVEDGLGGFALALDIVTSPLKSDPVHVEFDRSSLDRLAEEFDSLRPDVLVVGWYHSHPGIGCFLSDTDVKTQQGCFSSPLSSALVVDPCALQMCLFRVIGTDVIALPVGVFTQRYEDPFALPDIIASHGRYAE